MKVDVDSGNVSDTARMHAVDSQDLEYPISASLHGDVVLLTSWFSGSVFFTSDLENAIYRLRLRGQ